MDDKSAPKKGGDQYANMPKEVIMEPFQKASYAMYDSLDDTLRGVDNNMDYNNRKRMKERNNVVSKAEDGRPNAAQQKARKIENRTK